ncbi:putative ribonuclease H-like domain-containing protein [Tanacetum coccineum]
MTEMFRLLKELTVNRTPKKVLIKEEAGHPVTKNVNSISLVKKGEEKSTKDEAILDDISGKPDKSKLLIKKGIKNDIEPIAPNFSNSFLSKILLGLKDFKMILRVTAAQLRNRLRIGFNKWYQSFALRNFDLEVMEFESAHSNTTAKLPILKLGEYEMWVIRIKQYFQVQDYALWEVIENGNSWVSVPQTAQENGTSVTKMLVLVTPEEKTHKKNDVKARSLLLMALPNEHQLTFSQYIDAKTMFAAIETRFGGNEATKKTQKTLLKQQYENFSASSAESLDSIFNRLQKIISRLAILVWMNKAETETISIDDLYNNFKIVEQSVKKSVGASSGAQNLAFMTAPNTSSTNDVNTAIPAYEVSTASFSDNAVYAFMVENSNGSNLLQQELEQIHEDDLEVIDLKWQLSLLSIREKRYYQKTGKKIFIIANDTAGNQDNTRKHGNNKDPSSKAMLAIDGVGFDWSDMAEEQINPTEFTAATYKRGLATVEEQLITYRKNEVLFSEEVAVLKREVACKDYEINMLKSLKDLDKLLGSQITDKSRKGLGYSAVPPPHPLIYNRPKKLDLSYSGLDEFKEPEFKAYGSEDKQVSKDTSSFVESSLNVDKETVFPVDKKVESVKPKNHEKPVKKSVRYAEMYRSQTPRGNQRNWNGQKSNQLGSDFVMYNKACFICGSFNHVQAQCKYHQRERMVYGNNYNRVNYNYTTKRTHPNAQRNMVPRAVLMKTGLKPFNTARTVNTAHPKSIVFSAKPMSRFSKIAQSTVRRPFQSKIVLSNKRFTHKVNTAKAQAVNTARPQAVNTARPKAVKTARPNSAVVNAVRVNQENAGKPQQDDTGFVNSGCSRHMTGNIAYLSDFKEFDGGYVTFRGGAHRGRISGKGTLKTDSLNFEDVYFVNELKFNLFSVSHMCDKKNYVLFTNTECLVLSPNFKLLDENQILLKIPRKDNMYSFDMKNIVPKESLTCLVAKATLDESMLWHRRLGHINFKNINKLVKDNLVRGLPTKHFENDQTCVACLKGKQHRASCKSKVLNPITKPLFMLHMDLFGPTFVSSLMHKKYCLVVTDDYSRFTWVFFLTTKDETSEILKNFIKEIENLVDKKVKIIRSDNGTEFKNKVMDGFCREKGIKREYSIARTPQKNSVTERRNRTLIEAARTMLADSKLPTTFWAKLQEQSLMNLQMLHTLIHLPRILVMVTQILVDWETQILANDKYYYQIKRVDGSVKHYKIFSAMLYDFDRQDVLELYRLVKERFQTASPEGYDILLWGDLKTLIEPNEEDEIWRNQQDCDSHDGRKEISSVTRYSVKNVE